MLVSRELNAGYWALRIVYGLIPLLAGIDKFTKYLVDWDKYLSPAVQRILPINASPGSGFSAYDLLREAMRFYEKAELLKPAGNDEALLRWNTCARTIMTANLHARPSDDFLPLLE